MLRVGIIRLLLCRHVLLFVLTLKNSGFIPHVRVVILFVKKQTNAVCTPTRTRRTWLLCMQKGKGEK